LKRKIAIYRWKVLSTVVRKIAKTHKDAYFNAHGLIKESIDLSDDWKRIEMKKIQILESNN
jgi:hypothetical protein